VNFELKANLIDEHIGTNQLMKCYMGQNVGELKITLWVKQYKMNSRV